MAEVTLRLRHNPRTGLREVVIAYESDDDVLAHEHERDHRRIVEQVLGRPLDDDEQLVVQRLTPAQKAAALRDRDDVVTAPTAEPEAT